MHEAKNILGIKTIPVSVFLLEKIAKLINKTLWSVPDYLIDYLKYPLVGSILNPNLPANVACPDPVANVTRPLICAG